MLSQLTSGQSDDAAAARCNEGQNEESSFCWETIQGQGGADRGGKNTGEIVCESTMVSDSWQHDRNAMTMSSSKDLPHQELMQPQKRFSKRAPTSMIHSCIFGGIVKVLKRESKFSI